MNTAVLETKYFEHFEDNKFLIRFSSGGLEFKMKQILGLLSFNIGKKVTIIKKIVEPIFPFFGNWDLFLPLFL